LASIAKALIQLRWVRAVLDTNLFVSGLFSSYGSVAKLQQLWLSGAFELAGSEDILQEIDETLQKSYIQKQLRLKPEEIVGILELIREKAFIVTKDQYKTDRIIEDPDDKFLGCALEAKAYYVVSGDSHLLSNISMVFRSWMRQPLSARWSGQPPGNISNSIQQDDSLSRRQRST
jgi:putative PIN family toxin of toxin-antitoxin system